MVTNSGSLRWLNGHLLSGNALQPASRETKLARVSATIGFVTIGSRASGRRGRFVG
jgi:hypothetical protein